MTWTLWLELIGMFLRYFAPFLVGLLAHILKPEDQARLVEILTAPEMVAMLAASFVALGLGVRAWLNKTRFGLTAAAMPTTATCEEVKATAKTQAPSLSTPAHEVPQLTAVK